MIHVEIETSIARPIDVVFERLIAIDDYASWLPKSRVFLHSQKISPGPVGMGTRFIDETRVGTYRGRVTAFRRPTRVSFRMRLHWVGIRVMESRPGYKLSAVSEGTHLHHVAEGKLFGIFKLLRPYVTREARRERSRTVQALKRSLEAT